MRIVTLGHTGIEVSRLAIGTGTGGWAGSSAQTRKGNNWLPKALRYGLELGINFWELADQYGSHPYVKQALSEVERDQVAVLTKTTSKDYSSCKADIERFCSELDTDYLDIVLLHGLTDPHWNTNYKGAMDALSELKSEGVVKAVGASSHSIGALKATATEPWVDVMLARLNYAGSNMDAKPEKVIPVVREAKAGGKVVLAMKVLGRGSLGNDPTKAIKFVMDLGIVDALTIGPESLDQIKENARIIDQCEPIGASV